jgi:hypothetical protein
VTFADLRREFESQVIGELIYGIVLELSGAICRKYPEQIYNGGLAWDEHSVSDLAQEVVLDRLLGQGQLDYIFVVADSAESVRRLLTLQVKRALSRRRTVTPIDRLLTRVKDLAVKGEIERCEGPTIFYRPIGSGVGWAALAAQGEAEAAACIRDIPIIYSRVDSGRESQIYTPPALRRVLETLFSQLPAVSEDELRRIFEKVLTPWTPTDLVPFEEPFDSLDETMITTPLAEIDRAVQAWVDTLTEEECWVYYLRSQDVSDGVAAERIGKARTTVINIKKRLFESAGSRLLAKIDPRFHLDAVHLAQEHCARRLGESL